MGIDYREDKDIDAGNLQALFTSVNWESGKYPQQLQSAIARSDYVVTAWNGDRLVGLMSALSDGFMTAYFPYLVVHPDYQKRGIGTAIVQKVLENYRSCGRKVLIAYDHAVPFYEKCGFDVGEGKLPMSISWL